MNYKPKLSGRGPTCFWSNLEKAYKRILDNQEKYFHFLVPELFDGLSNYLTENNYGLIAKQRNAKYYKTERDAIIAMEKAKKQIQGGSILSNKFHSYHVLPKKPQHRYWATSGLNPSTLAQLYSFPKISYNIPTPKIALIELGGGYSPSIISSWCQQNGIVPPVTTDLSVDGATNAYTGNPNGADGEVVLDVVVVAGVWSWMTGKPANIQVIFAPNSDQGFLDGIIAAYKNGAVACGISWGASEKQFSSLSLTNMNNALAAGSAAGCTYTVAAGDSGASDGGSGNNADFPGSSPYVVCCGGTSITVQNNTITSETAWNADGGSTGGGFSSVFPAPSWQNGFLPTGQTMMRGVPDLAMLADPVPGWLTPFGAIGGTSAVAPAMAAFFAACSAVKGQGLGLVNPLLYKNEPYFRDILQGSN